MNFEIKLCNAADIIDLREKILRPYGLRSEVLFSEDENTSSQHYKLEIPSREIIGCASLLPEEWEGKSALRLRAMAIDIPYQNQGLGTLLLRHILEKNKGETIWCHARTTSEEFYKKFGWKTVSVPFVYGGAGVSVKMVLQN